MNSQTAVKLAVFNVLFVIVEIALFSRGLLNLGANPTAALITAGVSLLVFIGVNYFILTASGRRKTPRLDKLRSVQDYRDALTGWQGKQNPFNTELREAVHQLDLFYKKQTALRALLGDQAKEPGNPFMSVSEDVRAALLANMKKILNRMTILDVADQSKFPMHTQFLHTVLGQNKQLLSQYDNLIIEISQIGDSTDLESLNLESITNSLRELRDSGPTGGEELMQQGYDE